MRIFEKKDTIWDTRYQLLYSFRGYLMPDAGLKASLPKHNLVIHD